MNLATVSVASPMAWVGLLGLVGVMLALDLGVFHRKAHAVPFREAVAWSVVWVALSALFGAWVWTTFGAVRGLEFATGYVLEKALSVDNLFVMLVILQAFRVPESQRHRVLFWGVLGALVLRGVFIAIGSALVAAFQPVLYVFGLVLVVTAARLAWPRTGGETPPSEGWLVRWVRRWVPVSSTGAGEHFFVREHGRWAVTGLFLALVAVEGADLVFAVDSIPAVFAVTHDPFIVFSSNVLALLGLRALFFALAGAVERFHLLRYGLAAVLLFIGAKMLLAALVHVPIVISLLVIAGLLAASVAASLLWPPAVVSPTRSP